MEAQELRIGNYVNCHGGNDVTYCKKGQPRHLSKITALGKSIISWETIEVCPNYYHSSIEPIPLTEQWLKDFGFISKEEKWPENYYSWIINNYNECRLLKGIGLDFVYMKHENGYMSDGVIIKHVHQLQNLYFALTGKELTK